MSGKRTKTGLTQQESQAQNFPGAAQVSVGEAALAYAARGWPVIACIASGKRPLTRHGWRDGSTDPATIERWWSQWRDANIGLVCGQGPKFFVVDVDPPAGEESIGRLQRQHGEFPLTLQSRTNSGGRHLFFQHPGVRISNRVGSLGTGVDIRSDGGFVIAPPSRGQRGAYSWLTDPGETPIASAPDWLLSLVCSSGGAEGQVAGGGKIPADYAHVVLGRELAALACAPVGSRNDRLNRAAFVLGGLVAAGALDAAMVQILLREAAVSVGLSAVEAERTISSGLGAGRRRPRLLRARVGGQLRLKQIAALPFSSTGKLLLATLFSYANHEGWAWPGQRRLARDCSFRSRHTVIKALREVSPVLETGSLKIGRGRPLQRYLIRWTAVEQLNKFSAESARALAFAPPPSDSLPMGSASGAPSALKYPRSQAKKGGK